jgi:hypothetical protein
MGKHVHEHVHLDIDSEQLTADKDSSAEEKLRAIVEALQDENIDIDIKTTSEVIEE